MRVLIAEDSDDIREMLQTLLSNDGWEVVAAEDGREALFLYHDSIHRNEYFDLLILDVVMPRVNGIVTGLNIRNMEKFGDVPRAKHVYLTGNRGMYILKDVPKPFFDACIEKPFDAGEFLELIRDIVRSPEKAP